MSACPLPGDPLNPAYEATGSTLTSRGEVEVVYAACPGELVQRVVLYRLHEGFDNEKIIWEIRAAGGEFLERAVVGTTPKGFELVVPLRRSPSASAPLALQVDSDLQSISRIAFSVSDLRQGLVLTTSDQYLSSSTFATRSREARCRPGS
jgi:hypothetical protein